MNEISNNEDVENLVDNVEINDNSTETVNNISNNLSSSNIVYLEETQYNEMKNNLEFISSNLLISNAFVLSVLIYIFLSKMLERRKI
jgi:hypothetical protein